MSLTTLRYTQFKVQRLQCIGGHGRSAPYRITTYCGAEFGSFGEIMMPSIEAFNAASYDQQRSRGLSRLKEIFSR